MRRILSTLLAVMLAVQQTAPALAQTPSESVSLTLPAPGSMVRPSAEYDPVIVKGIRVHPDNPLQFDFIVDTGSAESDPDTLKPQAATLIKYFLTALTVPDDELWVNLSPYEKDRIIPDNFGITDMGRDLLAQDYILKQLTASIMYPEEKLGKDFWDRVYRKSQQLFGNTDISVDTFNKVWVVPEKAKIYRSGDVAFIVESRLKVMMEKDYLALANNALEHQPGEQEAARGRSEQMRDVSEQMIKEVLIPVIEEEVNKGEHFAPLRQIYHSLILATWFKQNLRESYLAKVYVGENKINGIDIDEKTAKERIYRQYLEAFRTGVYNFVREEFDPDLQEVIPRKYFSGGMRFGADIFSDVLEVEEVNADRAVLAAQADTRGSLLTLPTNMNPVRPEEVSQPLRDAAILSTTSAVDLGDFITYRKLFLSGAEQGRNALPAVGEPELFQSLVNAGRDTREPAKIDFLITRQAPIQQSVLELIANAADAITGRATSIGRFGVGALQMLAFVLDENNAALSAGAHVVVDTKTSDGAARQIQFFKGEDGHVKFNILAGTRTTPGTAVRIIFPGGLDAPTRELITAFVKERTNLFTKMPVILNGIMINPLDDHIFLNGDKVRYDVPNAEVRVQIGTNQIVVEDSGSGMSDSVILDKYLIPRRGENQDFARVQSSDEIGREVHVFYKGPQSAAQRSNTRVVFQVGGINIQATEIEGYGLPREMIIQLPSTTKLTVSRDKIEIDESTHTAVRALARKIVEGQPIHQIALMNGFMEAVQLLDASNTRVEALQPLVDTAKEVFIPFIMKRQGLILPNDELFRQMDVPADTLFLHEELTYRISPDQIPGAESLEKSFRPGRFSKAYVVPFKTGADVTFLEAGPYLLINRAVYEKYKYQPMLLNLRLNYYRGYGRRQSPRGTILQPTAEAAEQPEAADVLPMLDEFKELSAVVNAGQASWLQRYFKQRSEPTLAELYEQIQRGERRIPNVTLEDIQRFEALSRQIGRGDTDKAILSDEERRWETMKTKFISVNKEVDASEERVRQLFARLNAFVAAVPENMRDSVEWRWIIPLEGNSGALFENLLENLERILPPDTEFLSVNAAYFLNRDHPQRLQRYLGNLLLGAGLVEQASDADFHRVLSQLDEMGLEAVDAEVVETVGRIFRNRNLESMEEAFAAINEAVPYVSGDGIKRVISRWLRIYDQDPKAAQSFADRLGQVYATQEDLGPAVTNFQLARTTQFSAATVTPDGKRLISIDGETLTVSDPSTGRPLLSVSDPRLATVRSRDQMEIAPGGQYLYTTVRGTGIVKWNLADGTVATEFENSQIVLSMKANPSGNVLVTHTFDGAVRMWDARTGTLLNVLVADTGRRADIVFAQANADHEEQILVMTADSSIWQFDLTGNTMNRISGTRESLPSTSRQLLTTPDGRFAIRIGEEVTVLPLFAGGEIKHMRGWGSSRNVATLTPDGKRLVLPMTDIMAGTHEIGVFDVATLDAVDVYEGHTDTVDYLGVTGDGRQLVSLGSDSKIKIWNLRPPEGEDTGFDATDKPEQVLDLADQRAQTTFVGPKGEWIITASHSEDEDADLLHVYRPMDLVQPLTELLAERDGQQNYLGSADKDHIATADADGAIRIRNVRTGEISAMIHGSEIEVSNIRSVKFIEDAIAIHSKDNTLEVWDRNTSLLRHSVGPELMQYSSDGKYYIEAGADILLRSTHDQRVRSRFSAEQIPRFLTDAGGKTLVFVTDRGTRDTVIFDVDGNAGSYVIPAEISVNDNFRLSSDGRFMMLPSRMNVSRWEIWDLKERRQVKLLDGVLRAEILPNVPVAVVERSDKPHVQVVDLETGIAENDFDTGPPLMEEMRSVFPWRVSNDGRFLLYTTTDMSTQVWDLFDNRLAHTVEDGHWAIKISPDNKYIIMVNTAMDQLSIRDIATGEIIHEWQPHDGTMEAFDITAAEGLISTTGSDGVMRIWDMEDLINPTERRTGFAALNPRDRLDGLPGLLRAVVRFLREEDVTLLEEEEATPRNPAWRVTDRLSEPVSLALLNNLYETFSRTIQENPDIGFTEFLAMVEQLRGRNLEDYVGIIRSAIEGQDKTQRAWVREIAVQNARDATRRAREENTLAVTDGDIEIRNFMEGNDWVFAVRDRGTGMNLFHLIRYFFPLDQSSKDYLTDTGNLGQGNYTLFADFDRVFIRTSTGDGVIHELQIVPDARRGPVIESWEVLSGVERGTEIRRIKNNQKSDPQLESLFIQEALQRFAGGITSPEQRANRDEAPNVRDVRINYNGETFTDEIDTVAVTSMGEQWGEVSVGRADERFKKRVMQDGIFIKEPDQKELRFVPTWLLAAFERRGGLHIALPRSIQLNIPRTGYSQEHKFIKELQLTVLHNILKTVLRDYVDDGRKIPGMPADYFDNFRKIERADAQDLVRKMYTGRYGEIDEQVLSEYLETPTRLFALLSYLPFESDAYSGEMTLHEIRERFIERSQIRARTAGAVQIDERTRLKSDFKPRGEFAADLEESIGNLSDYAAGITGGRLQGFISAAQSRRLDPAEVWDRLPAGGRLFLDYLIRRFLQPVVGEDMPAVEFYNRLDSASASSGVGGMRWNLAYNERVFAQLLALRNNPEQLEVFLSSAEAGNELWNFLETLFHESQHLPQFEEPGDHTHHDDTDIEGLDPRNDQRFGIRMGRAIDAFLTGLTGDFTAEFTRSTEEMEVFIREVDTAARQRKQQPGSDSAVLSQPSREVGGIDLNPNRIDLEVSGDNGVTAIPLDTTTLDSIPVEGFYPVILNVLPTNLPLLLGANTELPEDDSEPQLISALREEDTLL
ncbi:MAG: WD40 repeat domain-containing protein [Candidatus Omnitrophica bacterium]|nr:WD40 repeat domain-containing protein [Candidatus Omnitrophota bacterium]